MIFVQLILQSGEEREQRKIAGCDFSSNVCASYCIFVCMGVFFISCELHGLP